MTDGVPNEGHSGNASRQLSIFEQITRNKTEDRPMIKREHNDLGASPILRGACHEVHSPDQTA